MKWIAAPALTAAVLCGCAAPADPGEPPTLASLSLTPDRVAIGVQAMVTGSIAFADPDGDVENIQLDIASPDGMHASMEVEASDVDGVPDGTVAFGVVVVLPSAGTYRIAAQLVDAQGNFSNTRSADLLAQ